MDPLKFNKIAAGVLCAGLLIMGFSKVGSFLVNSKTLEKNAYPIEVANVDTKNTQVKEASVIEPITNLLASANIMEGEKVAKKCTACHVFVDGGNNKVGPGLYNIVNKPIGKAEYGYSKAFAALNGNWTYEELNKFLYKPKEYVKGTKMNFAGLKKTKDRANLIAWLRERSNAPAPLPNK